MTLSKKGFYSCILFLCLSLTACGSNQRDSEEEINSASSVPASQGATLTPEMIEQIKAIFISPSPSVTPLASPSSNASLNPTATPSISYMPSGSPAPEPTVTSGNKVQGFWVPSAEVVTQGENGQVSTVIGTGTAGQGDYTVDHPRFPAADGEGNVYFLDGSQKTAKLRMFNGTKNVTVANLREDKVTAREGEFFSTGLQIVGGTLYFSSEENVYKLEGDRITLLNESIRRWMKENQYEYVYRMEQFQGDLVLMLYSKSNEYGFIRYHLNSGEIEELLGKSFYANPTNFFIHDKGIEVSSESGYIYYQKFYPKDAYYHLDTNVGMILDAWKGQDGLLYYALQRDKTKMLIYRIDQSGEGFGTFIAGSIRGYVDGIADQVQMDFATDFSWDGSGFLFADRDSNAIRKLWIDVKPGN